MIDKNAFDSKVRTGSLLDTVALCREVVRTITTESESIGGRKWQFSQLRHGWRQGLDLAKQLPRDLDEIPTAVMRLATSCDAETLRAAIVCATLRLPEADQREYKAQQGDTIRKDQDITRNRRAILSIDRFVSLARQSCFARSYIERIIGLCAATGRRTYEIACTASFEYVDDSHVLFTGQAKERGDSNKRVGSYVIPTLIPAREVIATLATIRADKPELLQLDSKAFHSKCAKELHGKVKPFGDCFSNKSISPKDLRSAWIKIAHFVFDEEKTGRGLYYARMLGHGETDLMTMQAYDDFIISDPEYSA